MRALRSLFIRATGLVTANPTGEQFHLNDIADPFSFFQERLDPGLSLFDHVACDVTDNCNLRCPFCINDFSNASSARMSPEHFAKVVEIAALASEQSVFISCLCEPLLHPKLLDLLHIIPARLRNKFFLTTNLSVKRLTRPFVEQLAAVELNHINVSVDSLQKDVFEDMRVNAKYDVFTENLDMLADVLSSTSSAPELRFITLATSSNLDEIPSLVRAAHERYRVGFHELRYPFKEGTPQGAWKSDNFLAEDQWNAVVDQVTALPFKTHVSKGAELTLCGFGQRETAPLSFGSKLDDDIVLIPKLLDYQFAMRAVLQPLLRYAFRCRSALLSVYCGINMTMAVATEASDGIVRLSESGTGAFSISTTNAGWAGNVAIIVKLPANSPISATVCATDAKTGQMVTVPARGMSVRFDHNTMKSFAVFLTRKRSAQFRSNEKTAVDVMFVDGKRLCAAARVMVIAPQTKAVIVIPALSVSVSASRSPQQEMI